MASLDAPALVLGQKFHLGKVPTLLGLRRFNSPVKRRPVNKVGQSNHRDEVKSFLMLVINTLDPILPPVALQWWHHKIKVTRNVMVTLLAHLNGVSNWVQ